MREASDVVALGRVMPDVPAGDPAAAIDAATDTCGDMRHACLADRDGPDQRSLRERQRELALRALI